MQVDIYRIAGASTLELYNKGIKILFVSGNDWKDGFYSSCYLEKK